MSNKIDWEEVYVEDDKFFSNSDNELINGSLTTDLNVSIEEIGELEGETTLNFKDGKLDGQFLIQEKNGNQIQGNFENGICSLKEFTSQGSLISEGDFYVYFPKYKRVNVYRRLEDGTKEKVHYKNELFDLSLYDELLEYSEDGSLSKKIELITYYNTKRYKISHFLSGNLIRLQTVESSTGQNLGFTVTFSDSGKVKKERYFSNDMLHGQSRTYHDNGSLKEDGHYYYGEKDGRWTTYYKYDFERFRQIKEVGYYKRGHITGEKFIRRKEGGKNGVWKYFDEDGNLIKKENWSNGRLEGRQYEKLEDGSDFYSIYKNGQYIGVDNSFTRFKYILGLIIYSDFFK